MFGLGMGELLVILAVALLVLGPSRLPDLASGLGKAIRSFRRATRELQDQVELDHTVGQPLAELRSALRDDPSRPTPPIPVPGQTVGTPPEPPSREPIQTEEVAAAPPSEKP